VLDVGLSKNLGLPLHSPLQFCTGASYPFSPDLAERAAEFISGWPGFTDAQRDRIVSIISCRNGAPSGLRQPGANEAAEEVSVGGR